MTHTYHITGMTCGNCKAKVEELLNQTEGVTHAAVNLETGETVVKMTKHITTEALQKALPEKYTITEKKEHNIFAANTTEESTKIKQFTPLFLILGYITVTTLLIHRN